MTFRGFLVIAQMLGIAVATIVACVEIESILFSGPALSLAGVWIAFLAYRRRAVTAFAFGLFAPSAALGCFLLIYTQRWGPSEAARPISTLMILLALVALPLGCFACRDISRKPLDRTRRAQFRIATLLGLTAGIAIVLGALRALDAPALVTAFSAAYVLVVAVFAYRIRGERTGQLDLL